MCWNKYIILQWSLYDNFVHDNNIWGGAPIQVHFKNILQNVQNKALRIITKTDKYTPIQELHNLCNLPMLNDTRKYHMEIFMYKAASSLLPEPITRNFTYSHSIHSHATRAAESNNFHVPSVNLNYGRNAIAYRGTVKWNPLPLEIRQLPSLSLFKSATKSLHT